MFANYFFLSFLFSYPKIQNINKQHFYLYFNKKLKNIHFQTKEKKNCEETVEFIGFFLFNHLNSE